MNLGRIVMWTMFRFWDTTVPKSSDVYWLACVLPGTSVSQYGNHAAKLRNIAAVFWARAGS